MRLPSKKLARIDVRNTCRLGRSANIYQNGTRYGNAQSGLSKRNKTFKVRGIAMNPVDHPNGGRTNTKRPLMNP